MSQDPSLALASADPFLLLVVEAQLGGALDLVDGAWEAAQKPDRKVEDIAPDIRAQAIARLEAHLAHGARPLALDPETLARLVQFCVGEAVGADYVAMLLEEAGVVVRALDTAPPVVPASGDALPEVAITGAGLSGIATAVYLKRAGIPFTIYEQSESFGGTWYDNRYPGCGVDTTSHFYAYSFAINPAWPRYFSKQGEMLAYIEDCVRRFELADHFRFGTTVKAARFDAVAGRWRLTLASKAGGETEAEAQVLVSAVGQLNVPSTPAIAGIESFAGPVVHTARWTPGIEYAGKRVALIGTGASGVQVGPTMAKDAARLTVFQRSPQWLSHRPNYHLPVSQHERWQLSDIPGFVNWHRLLTIWRFADTLYLALLKGENGAASEANAKLHKQWSAYIEEKMASRPDLLPKVMPDYPPLTKRAPVDFGWFDMLLADNVELVTQRVARIEPDAVVAADGSRYPADLIVLATGFKATRMLHTIEIVGRDGQQLDAVWEGDDPRAFLGMSVPGFPNFFIMYGPNTNLGHGGNLIFQGECQARYIAQAVRHLAETGTRSLDVRDAVFEAYNREVDAQLDTMVWSTPGVDNWFKNSKGRVVTNSPWRVVDYWARTRRFEPGDYRAD